MLIDTNDGVLMGLNYNLVLTAVSVIVAVANGGIEGLGFFGDEFGLRAGSGMSSAS